MIGWRIRKAFYITISTVNNHLIINYTFIQSVSSHLIYTQLDHSSLVAKKEIKSAIKKERMNDWKSERGPFVLHFIIE